jgi:hypothetical protein
MHRGKIGQGGLRTFLVKDDAISLLEWRELQIKGAGRSLTAAARMGDSCTYEGAAAGTSARGTPRLAGGTKMEDLTHRQRAPGRAPKPSPAPPGGAVLVRTQLMDNSFKFALRKTFDIIGMFRTGFNLELEVKAASSSALPPFIDVMVEVKEPHRGLNGHSSIPFPMLARVPRFGETNKYRHQIPAESFAAMMLPEGRKEFATVVRFGTKAEPATADAGFREEMLKGGWSLRGKGQQQARDVHDSGNEALKIPDAKRLMLAGGVELIQITVPKQAGLVLKDASTWAFLRSPADVFFYTGHAQKGNLVTHLGPKPDDHDEWLTPGVLKVLWTQSPPAGRLLFDLDVLIINGCNVLRADGPNDPGAEKWSKLLWRNGGPLVCLLGYRTRVGLDTTGGGHEVAVEMARRITGGLGTNYEAYPKAWLDVNLKLAKGAGERHRLRGACALDNRSGGYHVIGPDHEIHEGLPIGNNPTL